MPDVGAVLTCFRLELIAAGLVRRPTDLLPAGAPPMLVEPVAGAPAPGELPDDLGTDAGLVLTAMLSGVMAPRDSFTAAVERRTIVDVRYRSKDGTALQAAQALDAAIVARLIRPATNYGYGFSMGSGTTRAFVLEAAVYAGLAPIGRTPGQGYDHVAKYALTTAP